MARQLMRDIRRQREGDDVDSRGDRDELSMIEFVRHRRGMQRLIGLEVPQRRAISKARRIR
jgi:hypothetical protein